MDVQNDRRGGEDRRQSFLMGLDRRSAVNSQKSGVAAAVGVTLESLRFAPDEYWRTSGDVPPIE